MNAITFWLTSLLWDFLVYIFIAILVLLTIAIFQRDGYASINELFRTFLLLIFFGLSVLPVNYLMSFVFKAPGSGCTAMVLLNLLTGIALFVISFVMKGLSDDARIAADVLRYFFMVFPQFALCDGINNLNTVFVMRLVST